MNVLQRVKLSALVCLFIVQPALAQKKRYTMEEATNGIYTSLAPEGIKSASWEPKTNKLYHVVETENGEAWVAVTFPSTKVDTVLTLSGLNNALNKDKPFKSLPSIHWVEEGMVWIKDGNDLLQGIATANGFMWSKWLTLPKDAANITVDKKKNVIYTIDNNLFVATRDKQVISVTNDEDEHIINGQSVHRNEFGISGGIFPSPTGSYLAYYHMDETMVNDYPVIDWSTDPATVKTIKYPMAGGTSHQVQVRVFNPASNKTVTLKTEGPLDQYLTCVTWGPEEKYIYIAVLNRDQDHMWLNQYDAMTGTFVKTLFEETSDKYVEPQHELMFLPNEKNRFVWWSQRDGYMHLYLYDTDGKMIRQLTKGNWIVNSIDGINESKEQLIISASKESPLEQHAYTLDWNRGRLTRIDTEEGWHNIMANDAGTFVYDAYSSAEVPKKTVVRSTQVQNAVHVLKDSKNTLEAYDRPDIRDVTLTADDGTPLYGKLILPTGFNENKKYPVVVYLYNGPHVQLVRNAFPSSRNLWYEYMAQHGYIIFTMDGRGSSNRGLAFEQATFGKLGTVEMNDQLKGVEYLKKLSFVDTANMGVHGWSFGGFMTTSLMLRHPDVFKVGVAGGPVIDWSMYEIMYTERYMNTPETNKEGFDGNNLLDKVDNLKGKLLIIHGAQDDVVVWQHSMKLIRESVKAGKQIDYYVYPAHPHNVRGKDRVHLMQKITDYFDLYLK